MIPQTHNDLPAMQVLSAMQKAIRRGMEKEAMEFACELVHTSKGFHTMVCNRLLVASHEDIDAIGQPWLVPLVATCVAQAMAFYDPEKIGRSRMVLGTAIRALCRAKKSREGDHYGLAIGLANEIGGKVPVLPDWSADMHTLAGKKQGRGLKHFRAEGALLHPPVEPDEYESAAYAMLELKAKQSLKRTKPPKAEDLFD